MLFPFKSQDERLLTDRERADRLSLCQNFLLRFFEKLFEAIFDLNSVINKQNCRHWSKEKPSPVVFKTSSPTKQMVLIAFTKSFVIGSLFFSTSVKVDSYCEMIESSKKSDSYRARSFNRMEPDHILPIKLWTCSMTPFLLGSSLEGVNLAGQRIPCHQLILHFEATSSLKCRAEIF